MCRRSGGGELKSLGPSVILDDYVLVAYHVMNLTLTLPHFYFGTRISLAIDSRGFDLTMHTF